MTGRIWTFSNALSAARVLLVVPIAVLLLEGTASSRMWAAAIIVLAVATDFLDGIRRICTRDTDFHRFPFLDPIDPLSAET